MNPFFLTPSLRNRNKRKPAVKLKRLGMERSNFKRTVTQCQLVDSVKIDFLADHPLSMNFVYRKWLNFMGDKPRIGYYNKWYFNNRVTKLGRCGS